MAEEGKGAHESDEEKQEVPAWQLNEPETDLETGLTEPEANRRLEKYGPNCLVEVQVHICIKFLKCFWGPMPIMIWIATLIEAINQNWPDFTVLMALQVINGLVAFIEEKNAAAAIDALKQALAPVAQVKRDGGWKKIEAKFLVPGDLIQLQIADVIPADALLCEGDPISVDQAALTGESLPVTIWPGKDVKMGSAVKRGEAEAIVIATGENTFLGRAASLVASVETQGHFQTILFRITLGLLLAASVLVLIIFFYLFYVGDVPFQRCLAVGVVLLVASIPIAMQVVCTSTMAVGSRKLAEKGAIVARLSAIEELAGMRILCSDKTGTLTKNELVLNEPVLYGDFSADDLILWSALACKKAVGQDRDAIDTVICNAAKDREFDLDAFEQTSFTPFNPTDKRTEARVVSPDDGIERHVIKGAPQVILSMCANKDDVAEAVNKTVIDLADRGYRPLAVAVTNADGDMIMQGMLSLFDPPRDDTKATIFRAHDHGVSVKMITGDHTLIAKETARRLEMGTAIYNVEVMEQDEDSLADLVLHADGFAEVFPEHKFKIVDILRDQGFVTGMTGDGVNDAPALKRADIGIAVEGSTDAARAAADIVLTRPGLMTIIDAIVESRMIFHRMRNYCIYRVACSLQLLMFFFCSVLLVKPTYYYPGIKADAFVLPVTALVLITVLNDGTMITIAYDHVIPGKDPQKWDLTEVMFISVILGGVSCIGSVLFLLVGMTSAPGFNGPFAKLLGTYDPATGGYSVEYGQMMTALYLLVSVIDFLTVFSARTRGHALSRLPGKALAGAFTFATLAATLTSWQWFFPCSSGACMTPLPPKIIGIVWVYCIILWFIQDQCKLLAYWVIDVRRGKVTGVKAAKRLNVKLWISRSVMLLSFLALFIDTSLTTMLGPIFPVYLSSIGVPLVLIGLAFTLRPLFKLFVQPIANSVMDVTGPGLVMLLGTLLQIGAIVLYAMTTSYGYVVIGRLVQGLASSLVVISSMTVLSSSHPTYERGGILNFGLQGISAGAILGPILGGGLTQNGNILGRSLPFFVLGFLVILQLILLMLMMREGIVPWFAHPTPPDESRVDSNTPNAPHETAALVPLDWAGQQRAATTQALRPGRFGTYRHYKSAPDGLQAAERGNMDGLKITLVDAGVANGLLSPKKIVPPKRPGEEGFTLLGSDAAGYGSLDHEGDHLAEQVEEARARNESTLFAAMNKNNGLVMSFFTLLIATSVVGMVQPVIPYYISKTFNKSSFAQGAVLLTFSAPYLWFSPFAARMSGWLQKWQVALIGLIVAVIGLGILQPVTQFALVPAGLAFAGLGIGLVDVPVTHLITEASDGDLERAWDAQNIAVMLGMAVGPIVGCVLLEYGGHNLWVISVCFGGAILLCAPLLVAVYTCHRVRVSLVSDARYAPAKDDEYAYRIAE